MKDDEQYSLRDENIIYLSSDEWDSGLKTSQFHIAVRLARHNRVLYVNSIGLRRPTASKGDALRLLRKVRLLLQGVREVRPNLCVCSPVVIPFHGNVVARRINRFLLRSYLRFLQVRLGLRRPILWTFLPNIVDLLGSFEEKKVVYYCADKLSSFHGVDAARISAMEERLVRRAQVVFATSRSLFREKAMLNRRTYYMPHGVDVELFGQALSPVTAVPCDIACLPTPVIGFFGLVSRDWIDLELLKEIARTHPEWSMALIGKIDGDVTPLAGVPSLHLLGPRPYEALPGYCKGFDVAIIPFVISELTRHSNPLKLKEYLAAGVPVVAVDLPEVRSHAGMVHVAGDHQGFIRCIEKALRQNELSHRMRRQAYVQNDSWDRRFSVVEAIVGGGLREREGTWN
jgi:glycosyltransferase involved in cell wall biosynthesis